jgi:hypothetical protein
VPAYLVPTPFPGTAHEPTPRVQRCRRRRRRLRTSLAQFDVSMDDSQLNVPSAE